MTNIKKLKVSLTKHGAHKVLPLIKHFAPNKVLENTDDTYADIDIDRAQAAKNLSALPDGNLPPIWADAKGRSADTLRRLVFLGILFSHHQLITAFAKGGDGKGGGRISVDKVLGGKAFTTTKNNLEELGFASASTAKYVDYNIGEITADAQLADLAASMFQIKLVEAQWDGLTPLIDECISHDFHKALSVDEATFRNWLAGSSAITPQEDELPETVDADKAPVDPFGFTAGHKRKKTGRASEAKTKKSVSAKLLHNELQNALFDILVTAHGEDNVGTEIGSGSAGTSVDVVVQDGEHYDFYEIKTSSSVKKCLRQAIAQLLEYSYWPDQSRARRLIVVSQAKLTKDAASYVSNLRSALKIPLYYMSIDMEKNKVSDLG